MTGTLRPSTRTARGALFVMVVGCESVAEAPNCGDALTCASSEFCLVVYPPGSATGEQSYACQPIPSGCATFDEMCDADPPLCEDWSELYCGARPLSVGCTTFGDTQEAVCEL